MQIAALLKEENIHLHLAAKEKRDLLAAMTEDLAKSGAVRDPETCLAAVLEREEQCTTGVGEGIAIPHCKSDAVDHTVVGAVTVPDGVEYDALDGKPVRLVFMILTPAGMDNDHVRVLARLSRLLLVPNLATRLCDAADAETFLQIIREGEDALMEEGRRQIQRKAEIAAAAGKYDVLAVTACPAGIAHTYMAAQALEQTARELGIALKVETNGAAGVHNELTRREISTCKGILIAADRAVDMDRFAGRPVICVPVAKAITDTKELLRQAEAGDAPLYTLEEEPSDEPGKRETRMMQLYRHLMNGMSKILPLLVAAGVLGTLANFLPQAAGVPFYQLGMAANTMVLIVLSAYIAKSMAGEVGLTIGSAVGALTQMGASLVGWCMPGFVGSILAGFVSGAVARLVQRWFRNVPMVFSNLKPILPYPILGIGIAGFIMLVLNIPATFVFSVLYGGWQVIPMWAACLLGAVLGGMMAADLGGPINKIAYMIAILLLTAQHTDLMAAVIAAGMVPPLASGLAAWIGKNKFTKQERMEARTNVLMGLSFISEAALPLANRDPHAARPSFVAGAAVAAALSIWWGCGSPVPHGGIFVVPLMRHPFAWLGALALGTLVSTGMLLLRLKKLSEPTAEDAE